MQIHQHGPIYQLTFLPRFFPVNCYLIEEESELTLIDAALPYSYKGILKASQLIGKPITRILLTHAHDDHVGALDRLKQELPSAKVMISKRDVKLMNGDRSLEPEEPQTPIKGGVPKSLQTRPDVLLKDGDQIGSLIAISAPGHTPGHMVFLDQRNQALIAGDAIQTRGGIAVAGKLQPLFPFPAFGTWNKEVSVESVRKLCDLQPSLLAVGHGRMVSNPLTLMKKAVEAAENTIERSVSDAARTY